MNPVTRARKRIVLELQEEICSCIGKHWNVNLDQDAIGQIIDMRLPLTYAEAEAEMDELSKVFPPKRDINGDT